MDEAERCTRVGLIYGGRLIADGTPGEIKAMIPGRLVEFTPSLLMPAVEALARVDGVLEVQTYGEKLHVVVDDVARRGASIEAALRGQGIGHDDVREIEVRMEEAYISLIRRQESLAAQSAAD
jgi:ABC-2 type transport system ATP-binding protein